MFEDFIVTRHTETGFCFETCEFSTYHAAGQYARMSETRSGEFETRVYARLFDGPVFCKQTLIDTYYVI